MSLYLFLLDAVSIRPDVRDFTLRPIFLLVSSSRLSSARRPGSGLAAFRSRETNRAIAGSLDRKALLRIVLVPARPINRRCEICFGRPMQFSFLWSFCADG